MAAFVTFEDVSKVYHSGEIEIRAVDHISFTIEKGEFCVIVGPSGAGKTTVLNMLGGMDACSGGTITVDGTRVSGFNARQHQADHQRALRSVVSTTRKRGFFVFIAGKAKKGRFHGNFRPERRIFLAFDRCV